MEYLVDLKDSARALDLTPYSHKDDGWVSLLDGVHCRGWWHISHTHEGRERIWMASNLITTIGKDKWAGLLNGVVTLPMKAIGFGTGTTAPAAGNTALVTEVTASGGAASGVHITTITGGTYTQQTTTTTNDTARIQSQVIAITGTIALAESGVFDANTNGNMVCRAASGGGSPAFPVINVVNGDTVQLTWNVQLT